MGLIGNSRELQFRTSKLGQKPYVSPANKGEEHHYVEKEEEVGRAWFEGEHTGERQALGVMMVSHWLSGWGGQFLVGDAVYIQLSPLGPVIGDSFPSMLLVGVCN